MAIKITADKSKRVDITAKRLDDFIVNLTIQNENGGARGIIKDQNTFDKHDSLTDAEKTANMYQESVLLFTITTEDDTPVLAACSSDLDLAMCVNIPDSDFSFDPTKHFDGDDNNGGNYENASNQRDYDKLYTREHVLKIQAIANSMATASNRNTTEEQSHYGIKNLLFKKQYIQSKQMGDSSNPYIYNHSDYTDWLYNIFTNLDVVKNSFMNSNLSSNPNFTEYTGNRYVFFGRVESFNPYQIKFDHDKFNLPAGNYKYTFKELSRLNPLYRDFNAGNIGTTNPVLKFIEPFEVSYASQTTWIHGKLKINE